DLLYVDNNRPDFRGDPSKVPSIRGVEISNVTIENARDAGRIVGLPDSPVRDVALHNVTITSDRPLVLKNAEGVLFDHVTMTVKTGEPSATTKPRVIE